MTESIDVLFKKHADTSLEICKRLQCKPFLLHKAQDAAVLYREIIISLRDDVNI